MDPQTPGVQPPTTPDPNVNPVPAPDQTPTEPVQPAPEPGDSEQGQDANTDVPPAGNLL